MPSTKNIYAYEPSTSSSSCTSTNKPSYVAGYDDRMNINPHEQTDTNTNTTMAYAVGVEDSQETTIPSFSAPRTTTHNARPSSSAAPRAPVPLPKVLGGKNHQCASFSTRRPVQLSYCPNCGQENVSTNTKSKVTGTTWICVGVTCLVFWPLCWVPCVAKPCKQTNHYCENCGAKVGKVEPFQG